MNNLKKGFTLIELLIVIAILAVLSVAVVLVLNPAELLKQARDSTRISDMAAINSAVALYITDQANPGLGGTGNAQCAVPKAYCTYATTTPGVFSTISSCTVSTSTAIDGSGWVSVAFSSISAGSPISKLPIDPSNTQSNFYVYGCNGMNYKLESVMESIKYSNPTSGYERNSYDGGTNNNWYEVGNYLAL